MVEGTGTSKWAVLQSPQFIPDMPIDVPAIQETQPTNKKALSLCDVGFWLTSDSKGTPQCTRIYCEDENRALMSSVNGKKNWCHREQL